MATYYQGSGEMQAQGGENLQTLYLMNPNYFTTTTPYSETNHNHNHQILLNTTITSNTLNQGIIHQTLPHQLLGNPLPGPHHSNDPSRLSHHHHHLAVSGARPYNNNNLWGPIEESPAHTGPEKGDLSLSLNRGSMGGEDVRMSVTVASGPGSSTGVVIGSKYLKATQELLEEVVNVGGISIGESSGVHKANKAKAVVKGGGDDDVDGVGQGGGGGESSKKGGELISTAQRHELQMKKAKLLNMLDEVEQRYRQYHTQMQVIVASFEQAAGIGSAKSYTSLALKTISKQFKCLQDAIGSQIKATSKSLGEDDNNVGVKLEGGAGSRLRYVDHQLRQQRALQQLGMMQQNAWRPQRGLPERAVSVLRAWLFEHFLHPYPKDSDKHMLAKQTGLTRSQVSNWFINARVRLWKPMVEKMYVEEMKLQEQNGVTSEDNTTTTTDNGGIIGSSSSKNEQIQDPTNSITTNKTITMIPQQQEENGGFNNIIQTHQNNGQTHQTTNDMISTLSATTSQGFTLIGSSSDMESLMARSSQKKQRSNSDMNNSSPSSILSMDMEMKPIDHQHHQKYGQELLRRQHSSILSTHGGAGFNPFMVNNNDDIGRFNPDQLAMSYHGNAVSLTLGLPHCHDNNNRNNNMSISQNHQQDFFPNNQGMQLGRRVDIGSSENDNNYCGISMGQPSHTSNVYESIDIQSRKRFAAHQILHDFVA